MILFFVHMCVCLFVRKSSCTAKKIVLSLIQGIIYKEPAREEFLVVLVNSQMCQSWCHEILVTAPEMRERFFYKFISVLQSSTELARARDM